MAATQLTRSSTEEERPGARTGARRFTNRPRVMLAVITLAALTFYLYHALVEQARFLTTGYDLGIFDQAVRAYSHFHAPVVPLKGAGYNIFGDHFHPIITLLSPLYWIWDSPNTLLVAQAVLTAASIPVVYRFTRRRAGEAMSLTVAGAYAFSWPIQALIDFDFHEVAFATPLMALAIDALDRRDDRRLLLWCALLLLVREDLGIIVALIGVLRLMQRRPNPRLVIALIGSGVLMYGLTTSVLIPHFADGHGFSYGNQFGSLGPTVTAAVFSIITKPWHAIAVFFTPIVKFHTLALLLLPTALLPLRSPYAILALPLLAERFFNTRLNLWGPTFHYNALPWLILVLAMVDGAARLGLFNADRRSVLLRRGLAAVLVATPILLIFIGPRYHVVSIVKLRPYNAHQTPTWQHDAAAAAAHIPDNVCVAADSHLVPHLTQRAWTTVPQTDPVNPDFYVLDMRALDTGGNPPAPTPLDVLIKATQAHYRVVFTSHSFVVLRSPTYSGPSSQCAPLGPGH
jgi:uncharacterized membrane protein